MKLEDRCLGARATKRRPRRKDKAQVSLGIAVGGNAHGRAQQLAQANQRRDVCTFAARLKWPIQRLLEAQRALPRDVADAQQIIHFAKAAWRASFLLRAATLVALDKISTQRSGAESPDIMGEACEIDIHE